MPISNSAQELVRAVRERLNGGDAADRIRASMQGVLIVGRHADHPQIALLGFDDSRAELEAQPDRYALAALTHSGVRLNDEDEVWIGRQEHAAEVLQIIEEAIGRMP